MNYSCPLIFVCNFEGKKQSDLALPQIYTPNVMKMEFLITCLEFFHFQMRSKH